MLEGVPSLMAVTPMEELQRRHPEQFGDSVLRYINNTSRPNDPRYESLESYFR